jgi:hypothetical protein
MECRITCAHAPAIGGVRTMGQGDTIWLHANVEARKDWSRYADAIAQAVTRGAEVRRRWGL